MKAPAGWRGAGIARLRTGCLPQDLFRETTLWSERDNPAKLKPSGNFPTRTWESPISKCPYPLKRVRASSLLCYSGFDARRNGAGSGRGESAQSPWPTSSVFTSQQVPVPLPQIDSDPSHLNVHCDHVLHLGKSPTVSGENPKFRRNTGEAVASIFCQHHDFTD